MKRFVLSLCLLLLNACSLPLTPISSSSTGNCGSQWATKDLPELTRQLDASIKSLDPNAKAWATAYGEDCIYADGHADFSALETDFNVTLQVSDLSNEADLGGWIVKVMQIVENIPEEKIMGPQPGRVSIAFQAGSEQKFVNFYLNQYQILPSGLSDTEIYEALQTPQ